MMPTTAIVTVIGAAVIDAVVTDVAVIDVAVMDVAVREAAVIKQPKPVLSSIHKKLPTTNKHYQALLRPTRCFCQLADNELIYWARLHFTDGVATQELLHRTDDADQQEAIIVVALLGLEDHVLLEQMRRVALPFTHILQCRTNTRRLLGLSLKTDQGLDDIFNH